MACRQILISFMLAIMLVVSMSYFFSTPYLITLIGISVWVTVGHLVTMDDDMPGGWSNPEGLESLWGRSRKEFAVKALVFVLLLTVASVFPGSLEFGGWAVRDFPVRIGF